MSDVLASFVEELKEVVKKRKAQEAQEQRLNELRKLPCDACGKSPHRRFNLDACVRFALMRCEVCGGYFCCKDIMPIGNDGQQNLGVCKRCWDSSPLTADVRSEWRPAHTIQDHTGDYICLWR